MARFQVTQEHIDRRGATSMNCPVALAVRDAGYAGIAIGSATALNLGRTDSTPTWPLPKEVVSWIDRYDDELPVEPFEFEMEILDA